MSDLERHKVEKEAVAEEIENPPQDTRHLPVTPDEPRTVFSFEMLRGDHGLHTRNAAVPLMARRESNLGWDECAYCHLDFWALYFVRRGHGVQRINGQNFEMTRGDVYLLRPGTLHSYHQVSSLVTDAFYFKTALFGALEWQALREEVEATTLLEGEEGLPVENPHFVHLSPERHIEAERTIALARRDLQRAGSTSDWSARARLWCLLDQCARWRRERRPKARESTRLELSQVLEYAARHFHQPLTVEQLCGLTFYSRTHFVRLFTRETGMPPSLFIRRLRLEHARELLLETRHPVADIARLCGFADATTFGRAFKTASGQNPLQFRQTQPKP